MTRWASRTDFSVLSVQPGGELWNQTSLCLPSLQMISFTRGISCRSNIKLSSLRNWKVSCLSFANRSIGGTLNRTNIPLVNTVLYAETTLSATLLYAENSLLWIAWFCCSHETYGHTRGTGNTGLLLHALGCGTLLIRSSFSRAEANFLRLPQPIGSLRSSLHRSEWRVCRTCRRSVCLVPSTPSRCQFLSICFRKCLQRSLMFLQIWRGNLYKCPYD